MSYNRVRTPKFYIDAVLLARQLGYIQQENAQGKFYLNPTKTTDIELNDDEIAYLDIRLTKRYFLNSITHCFILGHQLATDNLKVRGYTIHDEGGSNNLFGLQEVSNNGWSKFTGSANTSNDLNRFTIKIDGDDIDGITKTSTPIGDISVGWSWTAPNSPDMELTQTFANESLKTQTTKGGFQLSNVGWTQPPKWGNYPAWSRYTTNISYPTRRSWSLKFSYLADENSDNSALMPEFYNNFGIDKNRGIFEKISGSVIDDTETFNIKQDFLSKVYAGTNGFQLPFIFQPDSTVEEYAIARVNANSFTMNQVALNTYDISLSITETF